VRREVGPRAPFEALEAMHDELWDHERGMARPARGVAPGIDALDLHSVRETALGALLDLDLGRRDRAVDGLRNVLATQYPLSSWPWSGTFPTTAEQPEPPGERAVEWVHYDPNWRQFLGCILALVELEHGARLPDDVRAGIAAAIASCALGEPPDRIPIWYTNPDLMHSWLLGHAGARAGDADRVAAAEERIGRFEARFDRVGDVDEYNSPTYDGIDLFALGLWVTHPPSPVFATAGERIVASVGARISRLFHPGLGAACGPYLRAYGLQLDAYVSLAGLWWSLAGQPVDHILPSPLDQDAVHVHDLYFLPAFAAVAPAVLDHLSIRPVIEDRHHEQRFGDATASSLLRPHLAVGWEHGRRHEFSLDQYVPFTAHLDGTPGPRTSSLGVMLADETTWADVRRIGPGRAEKELRFELRAGGTADRAGVRVVTSVEGGPELEPGRLTVGRCTMQFAPDTEVARRTTPVGDEFVLRWPIGPAEAIITIDGW
jgi:hypothetical protein